MPKIVSKINSANKLLMYEGLFDASATKIKPLINIATAFSSGGFKSGVKAFGAYLAQGAKALIAAHPVITSIAAAFAAYKAVDYVFNDASRRLEELEKASDNYKEIKSELEDVNSELSETQKRIDELKAKKTLTLVEQDELSKLEKANTQLERQVKILEMQKNLKGEIANKEAKTYLNTESNQYADYEDVVTDNGLITVATNKRTPLEYLNSLIDQAKTEQDEIENLTKELSNINPKNDAKTYEKVNGKLTAIQKNKDDTLNRLSDTFSDIENNVDLENLDDPELLEKINNLYDKYDELLGTAGSKTQSKLEGIFEIKELKDLDTQDTLVDYVKSLKDVNDFNFNDIKVDGIDRLKEALNDAGISADDLYQYLKAIGDEGNYNIDEISGQLRADLTKVNEDTPNDIIQFVNGLSDEELTAVTEIKVNPDIDTSQWDIETWRQQIQNYFAENPIDINTELQPVNEELDKIQSAYSSLSNAAKEYNKNSTFSLDTMQSLLSLEPQYLALLVNENGQLGINKQAMIDLIQVQLEEAKSKLYQSAINEINAVSAKKAGDTAVDAAQNRADAVNNIDAETNALNKNTTAEMMNEAAKAKKNQEGVSSEDVDAIVNKYTNMANALDKTFGGLSSNFPGIVSGFDDTGKSASNTADKIKDTQKQLDDLAKSEALDKIKNKFDAIELSIKNVNNAITALDNISDLTNENDFIGKIEITSKQLELAQEKTKLLADEFAQLREEEYNSGDQASELASRMESVTDNINENQKKIIEYGKNITSYYTSALTSISSLSKDNLSKATELIDRNIKTLSEGGLTGLQFTLTPTVPQSAVAKQRKENQTLLDEMNAYYAETAKIQKTALDLQYQEQVADNARKREDLLKTLNEQKAAISGYAISAKQEQTKFNADTSAELEKDLTQKIEVINSALSTIKASVSETINWLKSNPVSITTSTSDMPFDISPYVGAGSDSTKGILKGASLATEAAKYIGTPYVLGGTDLTKGVDCSGFVQSLLKNQGVTVKRKASSQFNDGETGVKITNFDDLQVGDVLYFRDNNPNSISHDIVHTGIYIGNGEMINAQNNGVSKDKLKQVDNKWMFGNEVFAGAKRYFATGTKDYGIAGENYKKEYAINKKTGEWSEINSPTLFDTKEYDIVGEKVSEKIGQPIPMFATGTPISDPKVLAMIKVASEQTGVPANVLLSLIDQESGGKWVGKVPDGKGYSYGYMQLYDHGALTSIPENRRQAAMSDPATNILEGAKYLKQMYDSVGTGNWGDAASAYNQGLGGFRKNGRNTYGNQVMDRATSTAFIEAGKQLGNISTTITSIQKDTSTIAQVDFKSQLKALTYGSDNTQSENAVKYQGNIIDYIKKNTNIGEVNSNELLASWEKLQNYQNEASKLFDEYGNQLTENRWSDDFAKMRSDISNATNEYTEGIMEASTDVTVQGIVKAFNQGKNILDTLLKYYNERKDAGASADELQTIIDAYTEQSDTVNELSNQYVEAIGSLTEYRKSQAENEMKGFENQLSWQEKTGKNIQRQLDASESLSQQVSLRAMLVQNEASKIGIYQNQKNTAHQSVLDLREEEKFKPILEQFDVESWFDAEGNASAQYENDIARMSINKDTAELVPIMKQLFELISVYKQSWYEADQNIQNVKEDLKDVVQTNFEAEQELIQKKIDDNDWIISMLSDTSFDLKSQEYSKQLNNHFDMIKKIEKEQASLDSLYAQGLLVYDDYIELSEELNSNIKDQLSSVKSILNEVYQIQLDRIDDKINDIQESSEKITDELQDQIDKLQDQKDLLEEEQSKWENAVSAVKRLISDQVEALNDEKDSAQDHWDDQIEAIKKVNDETNKNITLNEKLGDLEKANAQKISLVYQNGKLVYMANQADVDKARQSRDDTVREFEQEKAIGILEEQRDLEIKSYEDKIKSLEEYQNKWEEVLETYTNYSNEMYAEELLGSNFREDIANKDLGLLNIVSNAYYKNEAQIEGYLDKRIDKLNKEIKAQEDATNETIKNLNKQSDAIKETEADFDKLYDTIVSMFKSGDVDSIPGVIKQFCEELPSYFNKIDLSILTDKISETISSGINGTETNNDSGSQGNSSNTTIADRSKAEDYVAKMNKIIEDVRNKNITRDEYEKQRESLRKEYGIESIAAGDNRYDVVSGYIIDSEKGKYYIKNSYYPSSDIEASDSISNSGATDVPYDKDGLIYVDKNGNLTQSNGDSDKTASALEQAKQALSNWESESSKTRGYDNKEVYNSVVEAFNALKGNLTADILKYGFIYRVGDTFHAAYFDKGNGSLSTAIKTFKGYKKGTDKALAGYAEINEDGKEIVNFAGGEQVIPADKTVRLIDGLQAITADDNPLFKAIVDGNALNVDNFIQGFNPMSLSSFSSFADSINKLPVLNKSNEPANNVTFGDINMYEVDDLSKALEQANRIMPNIALQVRNSKK